MKKLSYALLISLLLTTLFGCVSNQPNNGQPPSSNEKQRAEVVLYYANDQYVATGDEKLDKLVAVKRTIEIQGDSLPMSILNELKKAPPEKGLSTEFPSGISFLGVRVENNIAYVDLSSKNLNGSSLQEAFTIDQIVYSLTELQDITSVQFLVDGKEVESLMGHYEVSEPISRKKSI